MVSFILLRTARRAFLHMDASVERGGDSSVREADTRRRRRRRKLRQESGRIVWHVAWCIAISCARSVYFHCPGMSSSSALSLRVVPSLGLPTETLARIADQALPPKTNGIESIGRPPLKVGEPCARRQIDCVWVVLSLSVQQAIVCCALTRVASNQKQNTCHA